MTELAIEPNKLYVDKEKLTGNHIYQI